MRSRDAALAVVADRVTRAATGRDPTSVLTAEALGDAEALAALIDPVGELDAAYTLGMFYWFRYLALPDGADLDDLATAAEFLVHVFRADPEAVPEPLRRLYQETQGHAGESGADTGAVARAVELFTAYEQTGELPPLTEAVALFRADVAAVPVGHPDRPARLNDLGSALRALFERTWDTAALAEAVQVGREAVAATPEGHPNRAARLTNLGNALALAGLAGDTAALAEAVQVGRDAVAATPRAT